MRTTPIDHTAQHSRHTAQRCLVLTSVHSRCRLRRAPWRWICRCCRCVAACVDRRRDGSAPWLGGGGLRLLYVLQNTKFESLFVFLLHAMFESQKPQTVKVSLSRPTAPQAGRNGGIEAPGATYVGDRGPNAPTTAKPTKITIISDISPPGGKLENNGSPASRSHRLSGSGSDK